MKHSNYLKEKVSNFSNLLSFFNKTSGQHSQEEKLAVFLSQIDFWEWELDEIIFSFQTFEERSKSWVEKDIIEILKKSKFQIKEKIVEKLKIERRYNKNWYEKVSVPIDELIKLTEQWNLLLTKIEKKILVESIKKVNDPNLVLLKDLSAYKFDEDDKRMLIENDR